MVSSLEIGSGRFRSLCVVCRSSAFSASLNRNWSEFAFYLIKKKKKWRRVKALDGRASNRTTEDTNYCNFRSDCQGNTLTKSLRNFEILTEAAELSQSRSYFNLNEGNRGRFVFGNCHWADGFFRPITVDGPPMKSILCHHWIVRHRFWFDRRACYVVPKPIYTY